jgi:hypothetical protein
VNPRTTAILLLVAVALGGAVWWSNRSEIEKKEAEEKSKRLFPGLEAGAVEWLALRTSDGEEARLERREGAWRMVAPVDFPADGANADAMASALATLASEAVIEDPQPPAVYGLAEGARVVRFGARGAEGSEEPGAARELRIGKKTPVGANSYAAAGEGGAVYTVQTFKTTGFERALDDLRERRPLRFERGDVARIELAWPDGGVELEKRDAGWRIVKPIDAEADADAVETLLSDLVFLRASGFQDEPAPNAETGLDRPQYRVVLGGKPAAEGAAAPRYELAIGGTIAENARAARGAEAALYEIPEERFQKLPKKLVAFRFKQLADFAPADATRFELVFADPEAKAESRVVTVTGERGDSGWTTAPEAMAAGAVDRLVSELSRLEAVDIAAEEVGAAELAGLGLAPPRVAIRVEGAAPEAEEAKDGSEGAAPPRLAEVQIGVQRGKHLIARRPDRATVFLLDSVVAEHLPVDLEAFRNRFVSKEPVAAEAETAPAEPGTEGAAAPEASEPMP